MTAVFQSTLGDTVCLTGIGLHSGQKVALTLKPAKADTGVVFVRTDLGKTIPMNAFLVQDTVMSSNLVAQNAKVGTVEHLLSAIAAMGIDNLIIELSAPEIPIMDGSAAAFLAQFAQVGIQEQDKLKKFIAIKKTITITDQDKSVSLSPYDGGFLVDFEIDFEHIAIKSTPQRFCFDFSSANFAQNIAKARTFGFLKDIEILKKNKLALGGSLDNAIVIDDEKVLNEGGLLYPDEFVRHKILDAIGDLFIIGHAILGKFCGYKSGHALNNRLIRAVLADPTGYEFVTFYDKKHCPIDYDTQNLAHFLDK